MSYTVYVVSNKPEKFPPIVNSLKPIRTNYFDGSGFESFSKLINCCVTSCPTETVIIASDKVLPNAGHVQKTLDLLDKGYAFVGLFAFAFFGMKKELFRQVGFLDERYVGGGFEDYDFYVRLAESNLAAYVTTEVPYYSGGSSWDYTNSYKFWGKKWYHTWEPENPIPKSLTRTLPEEKYNYDLGPNIPVTFLSSKEHTYTWENPHVSPFFKIGIY
jgi:hypothetical protein